MLRGLEIRDMLLIDRLELDFQPGLNVLTGETGAGKSILLDCLGFVLGWRGRADLVRAGAAQGEVTAVFDLEPDHPARAVLAEAGIEAEDDLILRRVNSSDGRKTAWVNDRRVSGEVLRQLSDVLVELHGQQDDRGLLNPRGHRALLDAFAGTDLAALRGHWHAVGRARRALGAAEADLAALKDEEDYLRHALDEFTKLAPEPGEEAELDSRRRLMQAGARIRDDIAKAMAALSHEGAEGALMDASRWLNGAADKAEGRLDQPIAALDRVLNELAEAQRGVEDCLDALVFDPRELEATEERLFAIRALARKHGVAPEGLDDVARDLAARVAALDTGAGHIGGLRQALAQAQGAYDDAARAVSETRKAAALRLDVAMAGELAPLKLERAVFVTDVSSGEAGPEGLDQVNFTVATNPGAPSGPLDRIASGGELSRFLLALKVCLTGGASGLTMIFDEIDRGVGGATADAVGRRLEAIAARGQVLVVTHSPQVAARGAHHWRVEKRQEAETTLSVVSRLGEAARIDEVARMLSGDRITDEARAAARALLSPQG